MMKLMIAFAKMLAVHWEPAALFLSYSYFISTSTESNTRVFFSLDIRNFYFYCFILIKLHQVLKINAHFIFLCTHSFYVFFFVYCVVVFCFLLINDFFLFSFLLSESFISKINQALMKSELIESYFNANGSKLESLFSRQA